MAVQNVLNFKMIRIHIYYYYYYIPMYTLYFVINLYKKNLSILLYFTILQFRIVIYLY